MASHFSSGVRFKILEDSVRVSIRISDTRVTEYYFKDQEIQDILVLVTDSWIGGERLQAKGKNPYVWLRIQISEFQKEIYALPRSVFQIFRNEYRALRGE